MVGPNSRHSPVVIDLADAFDPCIKGRFEWIAESIPDWQDEIVNLKMETAETAFQIGVMAGAMFAGCSEREIDRLERGLIHAIVSRSWRCKDAR